MMKRMAVVGLAATLLAGCGQDTQPPETASLEEALAGHVFELKEVDGRSMAAREVGIPALAFSHDEPSGLRISGQMCNNFTGAASLKDRVLMAKGIAMTRKLCADDQLNALDHDLANQLEKGATLDYDAGRLTLTGADHTLVFHLKADADPVAEASEAH